MKYQREANEIAKHLRATSSDFLQSPEWKAMRRYVVAFYGRTCMKCGSLPKDKRKTNVDHIRPRKTHPHLALDFCNLQVLCRNCNKLKGNKYADYRPEYARRNYMVKDTTISK